MQKKSARSLAKVCPDRNGPTVEGAYPVIDKNGIPAGNVGSRITDEGAPAPRGTPPQTPELLACFTNT